MVTEPNVLPANYRADILVYLKTYLNDPTANPRSLYCRAGSAHRRQHGGVEHHTTLSRLPALQREKLAVGRYEGSRDRVVAFLSGRLDTMAPARRINARTRSGCRFPNLSS